MENEILMKNVYRNLQEFSNLTLPNYETNMLLTKLENIFTKQTAPSNYYKLQRKKRHIEEP